MMLLVSGQSFVYVMLTSCTFQVKIDMHFEAHGTGLPAELGPEVDEQEYLSPSVCTKIAAIRFQDQTDLSVTILAFFYSTTLVRLTVSR